jgi:hypothetical protein
VATCAADAAVLRMRQTAAATLAAMLWMMRSDDDTHVTALDAPEEGAFSGRVQAAWNSGRNSNGGCLLTLAANSQRHRMAARADML